MSGGLNITPEARRYALDELCRRAGLEADARRLWTIDSSPDGQTLALRAADPHSARIEFPALAGQLRAETTVRKTWPFDPPSDLAAIVPEFVVPFASPESRSEEPLFVQVSPGCFRCTQDLLACTVLVLSRYEELAAPRHDAHGRFDAAGSLAVRDNYLDRGGALNHPITRRCSC